MVFLLQESKCVHIYNGPGYKGACFPVEVVLFMYGVYEKSKQLCVLPAVA